MSRRTIAPNPPVAPQIARLTREEIFAARSPRGGWTRAQLHAWGIPFPPAEGWIEKLTGVPSTPRVVHTTIFADASFCPHTQAAGYGGWIKATGMDEGIFVAGIPNIPLNGASQAEMVAIYETLKVAVRDKVVTDGQTVMLQSDSQACISVLLTQVPGATYSQGEHHSVPIHPAKRIQPSLRKFVGLLGIITLAQAHRLTIILRHVQGHSGRDTGRTHVHSRCDTMARASMHEHRRQLKEKAA